MNWASHLYGTSRQTGKLRRRLCSESGQSLIELALLTPVLLIMVIGVAEMGRFAYFGVLVGNAARAGAAWGAQNLPSSADAADINTAAQTDFKNGAGLTGLTVTSAPLCTCDNGGSLNPNPPTTGYCYTAPTGTNATAGSCTVGHWVVMVQVTATGTFKPMLTYPAAGLMGILKIPSLTYTDTATERVAQ
jgi:Flp pilus assembly protein TadG